MKICRRGHEHNDKQCKQCAKIANNKYYQENKDKLKAKAVKWQTTNKDKHNNSVKKWEQANKIKRKVSIKKWEDNNQNRIKATKKQYRYNRRQSDPLWKLRCNISSLIAHAFKRSNWSKNTKTQEILGCDFETLQTHLIQTAKSNYGGKYFPNRKYEIDHVVPLSSASTEEEMIKLNHYTNLQYLLLQHNREKSDRMDWTMPEIFRSDKST